MHSVPRSSLLNSQPNHDQICITFFFLVLFYPLQLEQNITSVNLLEMASILNTTAIQVQPFDPSVSEADELVKQQLLLWKAHCVLWSFVFACFLILVCLSPSLSLLYL